jgi:RHS repeat-associated protein
LTGTLRIGSATAGLYYIHNCHLGTPKLLTDAEQNVVWEIHTTPFGEVHQEIVNGIANIKAFPGQYRDSETGLSYNYYRDYDPSLGRYLQSDPIGLKGGLNTYGYVGGNPMKFVDPYGLKKWELDGAGNTSACSYYDRMAEENPQCSYFRKAAQICRGENSLVNVATTGAMMQAWMADNTDASQSEIYTSIRNKLVFYDRQMREVGKIDENGCTCGDMIDFYHDQAFEESGLSQMFYGGNLWPQDTDFFFWEGNPVPYDSSGNEWKDDWFN